MQRTFSVVGGDARQQAAGRWLEKQGCTVTGAEEVYRADYILLPMPLDAHRVGLARLLRAFEESGKGIACLEDDTHRGNPAVFSAAYRERLLLLTGDRGAGGLLRAYEADLTVVRCTDADELADADTPQALAQIQNRHAAGGNTGELS